MSDLKFLNQMEPWIDDQEIEHMVSYLRSGGWLTEFKKTEEFEHAIAKYTGAKYCSVVANGSVSLTAALMAGEISSGDEVLVPNFTMIASANAVKLLGATPVLVDIDPKDLCMDIKKAEKALTAKTKGVIFVPLNGRSPEMGEWVSLCRRHNLFLLEDSAQALGSWVGERHSGTFGAIGSFSFSAPKVITTGQGGALVTNDEALYQAVRKIKDFGRVRGGIDWHDTMGFNFKFTDMQAVIGIEQMKKLPWRVERKRKMFDLYREGLKSVSEVEIVPFQAGGTPWFIEIFSSRRDELMEFLKAQGIGSRPVYPPLNQQKIYKQTGDFAVSEDYCCRGLWLPSSSFLADDDIERVCRAIARFFKG